MHPDSASPHTELIESVYSSNRSLSRDSSMHRSLPRANSARASLSSNAGPGLANYSKLSFSMTYKNRQSTVYLDDTQNAVRDNNSSFIGGRESQLLDDKCRMTTMSSASAASTYCSSRDSSTSVMNQHQSSVPAPLPRPLEKQKSFANSPINTIQEDSDVSEVEIAAMQAKRALRRMCLSLVTLNKSGKDNVLMDEDDDDEDDDEDDDHDSATSSATSLTYPLRYSDEDDDDHILLPNHGKKAHPTKKPRLDSDLITISRADLQQLQSRLQALEHKLADQATKQADLESHIEREVVKRTKHLESQYEAKVEELTMARDFEVDQEIQRRLSEFSAASSHDKGSRRSKSKPVRKALMRASTSMSDMFRGGSSNAAPSDLDQFREFLQSNSKRMSDRLSRSTLFRDTFHGRDMMTPDLDMDTDDDTGHGEALVETVQKLRAVVADQENQLEQAKYLISVAAVKMTVTEDVVKDAWEEIGKMDARLERQAQELADLRRHSTNSHHSSSSFASSSSLSMSSAPALRASGRQMHRSS